ncbi:hypothetical protein BN1012_Phect2121 [Candidatus Phaeomarinobacter ectocarpi]|uniref:YHS domain-containing protein n=1 Tax=Candidatus Phaeomarinibacter ectocarpi TaxID=1458461 RepID=X5MG26_9HYPH|nr:YHS domain-containing (seleno)protein [Candidatus Phaeomarinobacter ectocarpi]CDO60334.1 hypothetical protein BN1012_Phect2121 [Candidatus Phaeomarinobacter ectocarpi]
MDWANRSLNALAAIAMVVAAIVYGSAGAAQAASDDLSAALADKPSHVATSWIGIAAVGYDVVAFFTKGEALKGDKNITATHDGATYRFVSTDNRDLFLKDPAALAPQYGGYGAMGVRVGKKLRPERSPAWQVSGEKLFLFIDDGTKAMWNEEAERNEKIARAIWDTIRNVPPKMLQTPATH